MREAFLPRDRALWAILAVAVLLRVAVACWPALHHADELWQYLEPARHLTGRPWIETWEARGGARSWLLPMLFAGPMAIGHAIAPASMLDLLLPRLLCVVISLGAALGAARLGYGVSRLHGLIAAFVTCIWYELVYFGPRTMSEPIATACFLAAAGLLLTGRDTRRTMIGGLLLGLCCVVRFQYVPAALVLAVATARLDWRIWAQLAAGGAAALAASAIADLLAGATPFLWIVRNVTLNIVDNRSAAFGVSPPWWYLTAIWGLWGWATIPIVAAAIIGARRYPALLIAALVNLALHALVPHKEYRFILLTTSLLVTLAAIGSVDLLRLHFSGRRPALALSAAWFLLSAACGALGSSTREWGNNPRLIAAWRIAGQAPAACGIGIYRPTHPLVASYALFGLDTPIYQFDDPEMIDAQRSRAFNLILTPWAHQGELSGYRLIGCGDHRKRDFCVFQRDGGCAANGDTAPFEINRVLERKGI
ncbi:MAG: hypothetical protein JWN66_377 [Sphingomonas bacterium]|uniref:mannosyltransferase n=1 Tax=Sphingomonas bacterium TaxID=1895847 RepID=UPI002604394E|nr:mannosyltransferase [Sphingomonas bacterium]MDB5703261.1 hypothetical protein [Sphingomonas bacterium]